MKTRLSGTALTVGLALALLSGATGRAQDQRAPDTQRPAPKAASAKKAGREPRVVLDVPGLTEKLKSTKVPDIRSALEEIKSAGKDGAPLAAEVESLLRSGPDVELAKTALETLGSIGVASSSAAMRPYARHRKQELRLAAAKALMRTGGDDAVASLREALSDPDPVVRGVAAAGLGALKRRELIGDLFKALDHKVIEAASSIGQLCSPEQCEQFAAKIGVLEFDVMTSGFDQILFRPTSDMPDEEKIRIVGRIRELGTGEAHKYLRDVQSRWQSGGSPRVKQSIDQAVMATGGSVGP